MPDYLKAGLTALAVALCGEPILIPVLRKIKFGQFVRQEGPQSHLAKSGTPTMGGIVFLAALPAAVLFTGKAGPESLLALCLVLAMGALGFGDDYLKIKKRQSEGLTSKQKFMGQCLVALAFAAALWWLRGGQVRLFFISSFYDLGILYIPVAAFIIVATVNGVNFTDGLDGLCSGVTFFVALAFLLLCRAWGLTQLTWLAAGLAGSCLGFLFFNLHPARVFMGDTGAMALGGAVAALALLSGTEFLLPLLGMIYVAEVLSVILQVSYFRLTGGKRLFRMSPLHHHFELCGWNESQVDIAFWSLTALAALVFLGILI
jgi:phospho-N-acetylmuramoyl-pentapeptide-transferase